MHDEEIALGGSAPGSGGGLIHNRARTLHPGLGRFMQRDPLEYVDGMSLYAGYHVMSGQLDPSGKDGLTWRLYYWKLIGPVGKPTATRLDWRTLREPGKNFGPFGPDSDDYMTTSTQVWTSYWTSLSIGKVGGTDSPDEVIRLPAYKYTDVNMTVANELWALDNFSGIPCRVQFECKQKCKYCYTDPFRVVPPKTVIETVTERKWAYGWTVEAASDGARVID